MRGAAIVSIMKTKLPILAAIFAAVAFAEPSGVVIIPSTQDVRGYVIRNDNGTFWSRGGEGKIVKLAETEVIIERTGVGRDTDWAEDAGTRTWTYVNTWGHPNILVGGGTPERPKRWREVYTVKDGKLTLVKIILPKVTPAKPAQDEKLEWEDAK